MWERADKCGKYVGAHVSAAGGAHNAVIESVEYGGTAFALFVRNQRRWISPPIPEDQITGFEQVKTIAHFVGRTLPAHLSSISADRSLNLILPHGSYLINLAHADEERMLQAFEGFLDELKRCESLGINLYNFHPGAALDQPRPDAIQRISAAINKAHTQTSFITVVLENTAGGGSTLGVTFQELADIIDGVKDKSRVGVCLDTCHMFAAGYDIRTRDTYEASMAEFEQVVGFKYLKAMHINDSKQPFNSKKDRHEHLGKGEIGWDAFKFIMNDERLNGVPLILETPERDGGKYYKVEIDALYDLVGKAD
ncbi:sensor protein fixL [Phlyctochytrium arcticum]|nr:sensor protein fixL [Phlyctochytrium arcticum]